MSRRRCCCGNPPCNFCSGDPPDSLRVRFANVAAGHCAACGATYNGIWFVLDAFDACRWAYGRAEVDCHDWCDEGAIADFGISAEFVQEGGDYILRVTVDEWGCHLPGAGYNGRTAAVFEFNFGEDKPACLLDAIPFAVTRVTGITWVCDWSAATCEAASV